MILLCIYLSCVILTSFNYCVIQGLDPRSPGSPHPHHPGPRPLFSLSSLTARDRQRVLSPDGARSKSRPGWRATTSTRSILHSALLTESSWSRCASSLPELRNSSTRTWRKSWIWDSSPSWPWQPPLISCWFEEGCMDAKIVQEWFRFRVKKQLDQSVVNLKAARIRRWFSPMWQERLIIFKCGQWKGSRIRDSSLPLLKEI